MIQEVSGSVASGTQCIMKTYVLVSNFWFKDQQLPVLNVLTSGVPTPRGSCSTLAVAYNAYADYATGVLITP